MMFLNCEWPAMIRSDSIEDASRPLQRWRRGHAHHRVKIARAAL
jgi:hypothetical protein